MQRRTVWNDWKMAFDYVRATPLRTLVFVVIAPFAAIAVLVAVLILLKALEEAAIAAALLAIIVFAVRGRGGGKH